MRIVFWTLRAGGGARVKRSPRQLEAWAPDAVALCEFRATPPSLELGRALASFGLVYQCTTADPALPNANRLLIATRWPLRRIRIRADPSEPGRWLLASVDARRPLTFGALHVPNRMSGRKDIFFAAGLTALSRRRRGPLLVVGATNSGRPGIADESRVFGPSEEAWPAALERLGWLVPFRLQRGRPRTSIWALTRTRPLVAHVDAGQ